MQACATNKELIKLFNNEGNFNKLNKFYGNENNILGNLEQISNHVKGMEGSQFKKKVIDLISDNKTQLDTDDYVFELDLETMLEVNSVDELELSLYTPTINYAFEVIVSNFFDRNEGQETFQEYLSELGLDIGNYKEALTFDDSYNNGLVSTLERELFKDYDNNEYKLLGKCYSKLLNAGSLMEYAIETIDDEDKDFVTYKFNYEMFDSRFELVDREFGSEFATRFDGFLDNYFIGKEDKNSFLVDLQKQIIDFQMNHLDIAIDYKKFNNEIEDLHMWVERNINLFKDGTFDHRKVAEDISGTNYSLKKSNQIFNVKFDNDFNSFDLSENKFDFEKSNELMNVME